MNGNRKWISLFLLLYNNTTEHNTNTWKDAASILILSPNLLPSNVQVLPPKGANFVETIF